MRGVYKLLYNAAVEQPFPTEKLKRAIALVDRERDRQKRKPNDRCMTDRREDDREE